MPRLHVCSLALIDDTVAQTGARTLITLLSPGTPIVRPNAIAPERHLNLAVSDINVAEVGHVLPSEAHIAELIEFARGWDRKTPLLIHCFAGVSRSTAAAFICACALAPQRSEAELAHAIRKASPTATPNRRMVAVADELLQRRDRMNRAIAAIGRGDDCYEGVPFALEFV